ncbi:3-ketoacyl-CoA synthase 4-like [Apium graveolens]|uniref:3-ketoacyl-CoA synthase 4-like n=1 Tax=Apium graveolens TaxID=4045 RepID=UPI003D7BACA9
MSTKPKNYTHPNFFKLKHVKLVYHYLISNLFTFALIPLSFAIIPQALQMNYQNNHITIIIFLLLLVSGYAVYHLNQSRSIYLVDFACFFPRKRLHYNFHHFMEHSTLMGCFDESSLEFQSKILERSGLGEQTILPESMHILPPRPTLAAAREEAEMVIFGSLDNLFKVTNVDPKDIGVLVVNCSLFNPTPSLSAMIVNKYKLRGNVRSFNLGGMGCSAGIIATDLASDMLQVHRNTYAIVVSTENITQNWYFGNQKSMLIPNCLFRVGGSAILLSNRSKEKCRAKYKLRHIVRTHCGANDKAFKCVYQEQDDESNTGVSLSKDLMTIAGDALKTNITRLGPLVLPVSELIIFLGTILTKKLFSSKMKTYLPDFKLAFDHFCIHAGGRAIIDELERNLQLTEEDVEASRMTLHRFGNTSSSSIWYELAYIETKGRMRKGHRVWQIALGSGFKCNSAVWQSLRDVKPSQISPWKDFIHKYPVKMNY